MAADAYASYLDVLDTRGRSSIPELTCAHAPGAWSTGVRGGILGSVTRHEPPHGGRHRVLGARCGDAASPPTIATGAVVYAGLMKPAWARDCPSIPLRKPARVPRIVHLSPGPVSIFVRCLHYVVGTG